MTHYTTDEIERILSELAQEQDSSVENVKKFAPFRKLGVDVNCEESYEDDSASKSDYGSSFTCSACKKVLMSAHLLELHILEHHDSYFNVVKDSQPLFTCFLAECDVKSRTSEERKEHCINQHSFPHDFRYDNFQSSAAKSSSVSVKDHTKSSNAMEVDNCSVQSEGGSAAKPKIANFSFGQKCHKTFQAKSGKSGKSAPKSATIGAPKLDEKSPLIGD